MSKKKKPAAKKNDSFPKSGNNAFDKTINIQSTAVAPWVYKVFLFAGVLLLYGWTYSFEYGIDDKFITNPINGIENNFSGFLSIFKLWFTGADYRPISFLSFWLERNIFGESSASVSHLVNVFLYGCIIWNLFTFIQVSEFYEDAKKNTLLALLCCMLFIVHPNHVSVVANIKARDNLLSMLFGLLAALQIIRFFDTKKPYRAVLFFLFIMLAFLSKLDAYVFFIAPALVLFFYREFDKTILKRSLTLLLLLFIGSFIALQLLRSIPNKEEYIFSMGFDENPMAGHETFINRTSQTLTSLFYYLKFLFYPTDYYFFYGYNQIPLTGVFSLINISACLITLLLFILAVKNYWSNKIYLFSLLFFLLSIAYALNFFVLVAGVVMDKYNFIASLGFCLALAALFIDLTGTHNLRILKHPALLILLLIHISFTIYRTKDWRNSFTLIEKDMPSLSNSVNANRMAAGSYINLALSEEMKPSYDRAYTDSLIRKGDLYAVQGLRVYDKVPDLWELKGLSSFYFKDYPQALQYFLKSKEVDSTYLSSINYIGYTYWALGKTDSAQFYFHYVINREPVFNYAANNLINMLLENNRKTEVDSLMTVFNKRFPEDKWLQKRRIEIYGN